MCSSRCFVDVAADVAVGEEEVGGEEEVVDVDVAVADFVDEFAAVCCLLVSASGTSCSSLNRWSPSRWRIASTIVSKFCRDVFAMYSLGVPSSKEFDGEGNLRLTRYIGF